MQLLPKSACLVAALTCAPLFAQAPIDGFVSTTGSTSNLYSSYNTNYLGNLSLQANPTTRTIYAMDWDPSATTLWGIDYQTSEYGTIDPQTGQFTAQGATNLPPQSVVGMSFNPSGTAWFLSQGINGTGIYAGAMGGSVGGSSFGFLGLVPNMDLVSIAVGPSNLIWVLNAGNGSLYTVNPVGFVQVNLLNALGSDAQFAQSLDFDTTDQSLWATLSTTQGSLIVSLDPGSGQILESQLTGATGSVSSMTLRVPIEGYGAGTAFCNPMDPNSTGLPTQLRARNLPDVQNVHLEATQGPPFQFGYFLVGSGFSEPGITVGNGRLCLSVSGTNTIGRYNAAGTDRNSLGIFSPAGRLINLSNTSEISSGFDVPNQLPLAGGPSILAGSTWHFQLWHRDIIANQQVFQFSNGVSVNF